MLATGNSQLAFLAELVDAPRHRLVACHRVPHGRVRRAAADALGELPALHARAGRGARCRSRRSTTSRATPATRRPRPTATPALLRAHPLDLCCCGIGENGHLAFNDPPVADFDDPVDVKIVALEPASRRQQVGGGALRRRSTTCRRTRSRSRSPRSCAPRRVLAIVPEARKAVAGARRARRPDHHRVPGVVPAPPAARDARTSTPSPRRSSPRDRAADARRHDEAQYARGAAVPEPRASSCAGSRRSSRA